MWSPCSSGSPQKTDSLAFSTTSFDTGTDSLMSFWSGPPWPKAQLPIQYAIQLSMIVVITSWAPTVALSKPAIPAQAAPASAARAIATTMCSLPPRPAHEEPTQTDTIAPTMYWPWPPMLNMPQRNANATARPVNTSGVAISSVCCKLKAASDSTSLTFQGNQTVASVNGTAISYEPTWKNQLRPVPLKISL